MQGLSEFRGGDKTSHLLKTWWYYVFFLCFFVVVFSEGQDGINALIVHMLVLLNKWFFSFLSIKYDAPDCGENIRRFRSGYRGRQYLTNSSFCRTKKHPFNFQTSPTPLLLARTPWNSHLGGCWHLAERRVHKFLKSPWISEEVLEMFSNSRNPGKGLEFFPNLDVLK